MFEFVGFSCNNTALWLFIFNLLVLFIVRVVFSEFLYIDGVIHL